ncbi:helix-turn-helix domain-containing protein [Mesonia aquimarina]|uniref:helix-turn-helix domain-containing protein n=1 Tax=Mesonia aquimarina TaxID=1504967 RepID=UPI000EF595B8|nr:AraC family transcriptional regulator [Mesonia aquimarina]
MIVFTIEGISVSEILSELSVQFQTSLTEHLSEYKLDIPQHLGEGFIQGINFPNGVGLLEFKGKFIKQVVLNFTSKKVHPLKFIYCQEGSLIHSIKPDSERRKIQKYQSAIISTYYHYGHIYKFPTNEAFNFQVVEIDRKAFKEHINYKLEEIPYYFYKIFADVEGIREVFYRSNYSLHLAQVIKDIQEFEKDNLIRVNFLGAKALEALSLMLAQYEDDIKQDKKQNILRKSEFEVVNDVEDYINDHLMNIDTIDEISKKFGLNKQKLQQGFQLKHQQSINEYIKNQRLELSLKLLDKGEKNISEIVYEIGLSSRSYFSKIFKEKYKIAPSSYLNSK